MTLLPQPDAEFPLSAPNRPDPTPHTRRFLFWSAWMLISLVVLNFLLYRLSGLDAYLLLAGAVMVPCLLYQYFSPTMRILKGIWIALTLPFWLIAIFLGYHLVLGAWAFVTAKPIPAALTIPPASIKGVRLVSPEFPEFSDNEREMRYAFTSAVQVLPGPVSGPLTMAPSLDTVLPVLNHYLEATAATPYARPYALQADCFEQNLSLIAAANESRLIYYTREEQPPEAQALLLAMLRSEESQLFGAHRYHDACGNIRRAGSVLLSQNSISTELTKGIEPEVLERVRGIRKNIPVAIGNTWAAELASFQEWEDLWTPPNGIGGAERRHFGDDPWQWALSEVVLHLENGLDMRARRWPFMVRRATVSEYAQFVELCRVSMDEDPRLTRPRILQAQEQLASSLFKPNPSGKKVLRVHGEVGDPRPLIFETHAILNAMEYGLLWQTRQPLPTALVQLDPSAGRPYELRVTSTNGIETLQIGYGTVPSDRVEQKRKMAKLGFKSGNVLQFTRPLQP